MKILAGIIRVAYMGRAVRAMGEGHMCASLIDLDTAAVVAAYGGARDELRAEEAAWGMDLNPYTLGWFAETNLSWG